MNLLHGDDLSSKLSTVLNESVVLLTERFISRFLNVQMQVRILLGSWSPAFDK